MNHSFPGCEIHWYINTLRLNIDITVSIPRISVFSTDMTMIFYFNIAIDVIIITDPTFSRTLKILITLFSHHNFFVKIFFFNVSGTMINLSSCSFWPKLLSYVIGVTSSLGWKLNIKQYDVASIDPPTISEMYPVLVLGSPTTVKGKFFLCFKKFDDIRPFRPEKYK